MQDYRVRCGDCGTDVEIDDKVRLRAKGQNKYRCSRCGVHITQLSREFGSWPTETFQALDADAKTQFYKSIRDDTNAKEIKEKCVQYLRGYEHHEDWYAEGGEFLPLGVWAKNGYNTQDIEDKSYPWDIREHRVLGTTFRVPIYSAGHRGAKGKAREEENSGAGPSRKRKATEDGADGEASEDGSDSSSSTSSSRSKRKRKKDKKDKKVKKNGKKDKRDKEKAREKEKQRKLEDAATRKLEGQNTRFAEQIVEKVDDTNRTLTSVCGEEMFDELPDNVKRSMKAAKAQLTEIAFDCKKVRDGEPGHKIRHVADAKTCKALLADLKRKIDNTKHMLVQARRFG